MIKLRNIIKSDIEDLVRWDCEDTEWAQKWDSPWLFEEIKKEDSLKEWNEIYNKVKDYPIENRNRLEIEFNGKHVGWVCRYFDLGYLENKESHPIIGIDIPETFCQGKSIGTLALKAYIEQLSKEGYKAIYCQTWSGNIRMIKVLDKLGFKEYYRKENYRVVDNKLYDAITFILEIIQS